MILSAAKTPIATLGGYPPTAGGAFSMRAWGVVFLFGVGLSGVPRAFCLPQAEQSGAREERAETKNSKRGESPRLPEEHSRETAIEKGPSDPPQRPAKGDMRGMHHGGMGTHQPASFLEAIVHHATSGTSAEPDSTPHAMLMKPTGGWNLMFHGVAFLNSIQQSGPRGADKIFSTNWIMPMAQRQFSQGTLTLRAMLSFEPATISRRRFPELFQLGETAYGKPIVDGQHPHDFFMELALLYDHRVGREGLISFYAAPVGDPAMGPAAFPHRASAGEDPLSPLGHHLQDSTHIANDVVTLGVAIKSLRLEASGFHGREPDQYRWDIDSGKIDSWSARLTVSPSQNWSGQYSIARLESPEELHPEADTLRMTASVSYNRPIRRGNWASTLIWGRNRSQQDGEVLNSYLAESTLQFLGRNHVWGRVENVDRTNDLLLDEKPAPAGFEERFLARVRAYTMGYDRDFDLIPSLRTALGGQITLYGIPGSLVPIYGSNPVGIALFLRVRPFGSNH